MRYNTKIKSKTFPETIYFFDEKYFWKILKNRKFQKVTFSIFVVEKLKISKKSTFSKKVTFRKFRFFKIFRKIVFVEKINVFGFFVRFYLLSYLMYYPIKWHRGTPTVPPVGAVNVPAENPKIQKIHIFEDFWEHFFLINHIGFSLKYVIPKSSTDFFIENKKVFEKK